MVPSELRAGKPQGRKFKEVKNVIGVKNVLKFKLNAFSRTQNTQRMTSKEGNQMLFSKEEQTIVSFWRFLQETKKKNLQTSA